MLFKRETISGKLLQRPPTIQSLGIVGNGLDAKHAFAFGIDLQTQLAAVQLEDRQIIRRSLDRHFPVGRMLFPSAISRTMLVSEDGLNGLQVESRTAEIG